MDENNLNYNNYNQPYNLNSQEKKEKRRKIIIAIIIFLVLVISTFIASPYLKKYFVPAEPENKDQQVIAYNDKEDAFSEEIRRLIKELYNKGKTINIKHILQDMGYKDDYINGITDDYDKIIKAIFDKIENKDYTEPETLDIIHTWMDYVEPEPTKPEPVPSEPDKPKQDNPKQDEPEPKPEPEPTEPDKPKQDESEPTKPEPEKPTGESETSIDSGKQINTIFENLETIPGSVVTEQPLVLSDNKSIKFNIVLDAPGDYYGFTVNIKNNSNIDVKVDNVTSNILTEEQDKYLGFSLTYEDGTAIKKDDVIKIGETKKIKFISLYKYVDEINNHDVIANYNGQITFVQK